MDKFWGGLSTIFFPMIESWEREDVTDTGTHFVLNKTLERNGYTMTVTISQPHSGDPALEDA